MRSGDHWAVTVDRNGVNILTIETRCLSGKARLSSQDEQTIRDCAQQLLAFIGSAKEQRKLT